MSYPSRRAVLLAAMVCCVGFFGALQPLVAQSQTLPRGFDDGNGGLETRLPFAANDDQTWQWHYAASEIDSASPIVISELYVRTHAHRDSGSFDFTSLEVVIASSPTAYSRTGAAGQPDHDPVFANNLGPDQVVVRPAAPWTGRAPVGRWIPLGLSQSFTFDPGAGRDLVVQLRLCGVQSPFSSGLLASRGAPGTNGGNRYGALTSCSATAEDFFNAELVPVLRVAWHPVGATPSWQVNRPAASLTVDGQPGTGFRPATFNLCSEDFASVTFESTQIGFPWEGIVGVRPPVPLGGGGAMLPDGQMVNIDLRDPGLRFQYGGTMPDFTLRTWIANVALPFQAGDLQGSRGMQMVVVDPAAAIGFSLSGATHVTVDDPAGAQGPSGDEELLQIDLGRSPVCGPLEVRFHGLPYRFVRVSSNGRVRFGGSSTDFSPTLGEALGSSPFLGLWADLDPSLGGRIEVLGMSAERVRVSWTDVPFYGEPTSAVSYWIEFDTATDAIVLGGLSGIPEHPSAGQGAAQFLGLSAGSGRAAMAIPSVFAPTTSGQSATPFAMLYDFWDGSGTGPGGTSDGRLLSIQGGVDEVTFLPLPGGGYSWSAL